MAGNLFAYLAIFHELYSKLKLKVQPLKREIMKRVHPRLKENIAQVLKDTPADKTLYFECEIGDWVEYVTKENIIEKAMAKMPEFFFNSFISVEFDNNILVPKFLRVEQAAWTAAQNEYSAQKGEAMQGDYRGRE